MKGVSVTVFGGANKIELAKGCACGRTAVSPMSMREDAEDLRKYLAGKYGDNVKFAYVDVQSDDMNKYPAILETIKTVSLPLIVINGEPRLTVVSR